MCVCDYRYIILFIRLVPKIPQLEQNQHLLYSVHAEFGLKLVTNMVQAVYVDVLKPESLLYGAIIRLERSISF